jgi:hypothetical protein
LEDDPCDRRQRDCDGEEDRETIGRDEEEDQETIGRVQEEGLCGRMTR